MKKKLLQTLSLTSLLALLLAVPVAAAESVPISVNGEQAVAVDSYLEEGVTMIGVDSFARLTGAGLEKSAAGVKIVKNGRELVLQVGQRKALLDGSTLYLIKAPVKVGEQIYIPLRPVSAAFGFGVAWDKAAERVKLEINETREGLTPVEVLFKAEQATRKFNTYALEGSYTMDMEVNADGIKEQIPGITATMSGQVQNKPFQAYLVQAMEMPGTAGQEIPGLTMETYLTEEKLYLKGPDGRWTVQDLPFGPEFWQEQQALQSDPLRAAAQLREMGVLLNFGDDAVVNGQEYYVINGSLDMEKFRESNAKIMEQALSSVPLPQGDQEKVQETIKKLMETAQIDYFYRIYINKNTWLTDIIECKMAMDLTLNLKGMGIEGEDASASIPQELQMKLKMDGRFTMKDPGKPFAAPDVSQAVPIDELVPEGVN